MRTQKPDKNVYAHRTQSNGVSSNVNMSNIQTTLQKAAMDQGRKLEGHNTVLLIQTGRWKLFRRKSGRKKKLKWCSD